MFWSPFRQPLKALQMTLKTRYVKMVVSRQTYKLVMSTHLFMWLMIYFLVNHYIGIIVEMDLLM